MELDCRRQTARFRCESRNPYRWIGSRSIRCKGSCRRWSHSHSRRNCPIRFLASRRILRLLRCNNLHRHHGPDGTRVDLHDRPVSRGDDPHRYACTGNNTRATGAGHAVRDLVATGSGIDNSSVVDCPRCNSEHAHHSASHVKRESRARSHSELPDHGRNFERKLSPDRLERECIRKPSRQ